MLVPDGTLVRFSHSVVVVVVVVAAGHKLSVLDCGSPYQTHHWHYRRCMTARSERLSF